MRVHLRKLLSMRVHLRKISKHTFSCKKDADECVCNLTRVADIEEMA